MHVRKIARWGAPVVALLLIGAGCGDDDSSDDSSEPATTTTAAPSAELTELCAVAQEMYDSEDFPTAEQIERYRAVAPEELQDDVKVAGDAIVDAGGDPVKTFAAVADDDVEEATNAINAYEEANCGIPHSEDDALAEGATRESEKDANKVDVTSVEYEFTIEDDVKPGRTSFTLTNKGAEAHFMGIAKLKDGVTMDEALQAEDSSTVLDGEWDTNLAAPGGDDEVVTFDVEPGTYAVVCFLPSADGTPHAFLGMAKEFTVA